MIRKPIVAGQFYEQYYSTLSMQIESSFFHNFGPGKLPVVPSPKEILDPLEAVVVPHAGYMFSAPAQAYGYKEISERKMPELFLILGTNHLGVPTCTTESDFKTPFGIVKTDGEFIKELTGSTEVEFNEGAQAREHSIEVQLPFLQFAFKERMEKLRIVPIMVGNNLKASELGKSLKRLLKGRDATIIVSSDFTHFGYSYRYRPFTTDIKENLYKLDLGAIELILRKDAKGFEKYVKETGATICGADAIATMLNMIKSKQGELLKYYTSGDIIGDYNSAVGYAAVKFE